TRTYPGFGAAAQEEADSRIFGGIHFRFDSVAGQGIGRSVADYVFEHVLLPRPEPSRVRAAGASMALVQPAAGAPTDGEALAVPLGRSALGRVRRRAGANSNRLNRPVADPTSPGRTVCEPGRRPRHSAADRSPGEVPPGPPASGGRTCSYGRGWV